MKQNKVYLRTATPRSLKDPQTLRMALSMVGTVAAMAVVTVMLHLKGLAFANRFTVFAVAWLVMGAVPCALMIFNSYAFVQDEDLVYNPIGLYQCRCPRASLEKAVVKNGRIEIAANGKTLFSMPDSVPARELVSGLRIPLA